MVLIKTVSNLPSFLDRALQGSPNSLMVKFAIASPVNPLPTHAVCLPPPTLNLMADEICTVLSSHGLFASAQSRGSCHLSKLKSMSYYLSNGNVPCPPTFWYEQHEGRCTHRAMGTDATGGRVQGRESSLLPKNQSKEKYSMRGANTEQNIFWLMQCGESRQG